MTWTSVKTARSYGYDVKHVNFDNGDCGWVVGVLDAVNGKPGNWYKYQAFGTATKQKALDTAYNMHRQNN